MADWDFDKPDDEQLISYELLAEWDGAALGQNSTTEDLRKAANAICSRIAQKKTLGVPVGIDWDLAVTFWGNRKAGTRLTYFTGYLTRALETLGCPVIDVSPASLRTGLGLPTRTPKDQVTAQFSFFPRDANEDLRDALLLSYVVAYARDLNG